MIHYEVTRGFYNLKRVSFSVYNVNILSTNSIIAFGKECHACLDRGAKFN